MSKPSEIGLIYTERGHTAVGHVPESATSLRPMADAMAAYVEEHGLNPRQKILGIPKTYVDYPAKEFTELADEGFDIVPIDEIARSFERADQLVEKIMAQRAANLRQRVERPSEG